MSLENMVAVIGVGIGAAFLLGAVVVAVWKYRRGTLAASELRAVVIVAIVISICALFALYGNLPSTEESIISRISEYALAAFYLGLVAWGSWRLIGAVLAVSGRFRDASLGYKIRFSAWLLVMAVSVSLICWFAADKIVALHPVWLRPAAILAGILGATAATWYGHTREIAFE